MGTANYQQKQGGGEETRWEGKHFRGSTTLGGVTHFGAGAEE